MPILACVVMGIIVYYILLNITKNECRKQKNLQVQLDKSLFYFDNTVKNEGFEECSNCHRDFYNNWRLCPYCGNIRNDKES